MLEGLGLEGVGWGRNSVQVWGASTRTHSAPLATWIYSFSQQELTEHLLSARH